MEYDKLCQPWGKDGNQMETLFFQSKKSYHQ